MGPVVRSNQGNIPDDKPMTTLKERIKALELSQATHTQRHIPSSGTRLIGLTCPRSRPVHVKSTSNSGTQWDQKSIDWPDTNSWAQWSAAEQMVFHPNSNSNNNNKKNKSNNNSFVNEDQENEYIQHDKKPLPQQDVLSGRNCLAPKQENATAPPDRSSASNGSFFVEHSTVEKNVLPLQSDLSHNNLGQLRETGTRMNQNTSVQGRMNSAAKPKLQSILRQTTQSPKSIQSISNISLETNSVLRELMHDAGIPVRTKQRNEDNNSTVVAWERQFADSDMYDESETQCTMASGTHASLMTGSTLYTSQSPVYAQSMNADNNTCNTTIASEDVISGYAGQTLDGSSTIQSANNDKHLGTGEKNNTSTDVTTVKASAPRWYGRGGRLGIENRIDVFQPSTTGRDHSLDAYSDIDSKIHGVRANVEARHAPILVGRLSDQRSMHASQHDQRPMYIRTGGRLGIEKRIDVFQPLSSSWFYTHTVDSLDRASSVGNTDVATGYLTPRQAISIDTSVGRHPYDQLGLIFNDELCSTESSSIQPSPNDQFNEQPLNLIPARDENIHTVGRLHNTPSSASATEVRQSYSIQVSPANSTGGSSQLSGSIGLGLGSNSCALNIPKSPVTEANNTPQPGRKLLKQGSIGSIGSAAREAMEVDRLLALLAPLVKEQQQEQLRLQEAKLLERQERLREQQRCLQEQEKELKEQQKSVREFIGKSKPIEDFSQQHVNFESMRRLPDLFEPHNEGQGRQKDKCERKDRLGSSQFYSRQRSSDCDWQTSDTMKKLVKQKQADAYDSGHQVDQSYIHSQQNQIDEYYQSMDGTFLRRSLSTEKLSSIGNRFISRSSFNGFNAFDTTNLRQTRSEPRPRRKDITTGVIFDNERHKVSSVEMNWNLHQSDAKPVVHSLHSLRQHTSLSDEDFLKHSTDSPHASPRPTADDLASFLSNANLRPSCAMEEDDESIQSFIERYQQPTSVFSLDERESFSLQSAEAIERTIMKVHARATNSKLEPSQLDQIRFDDFALNQHTNGFHHIYDSTTRVTRSSHILHEANTPPNGNNQWVQQTRVKVDPEGYISSDSNALNVAGPGPTTELKDESEYSVDTFSAADIFANLDDFSVDPKSLPGQPFPVRKTSHVAKHPSARAAVTAKSALTSLKVPLSLFPNEAPSVQNETIGDTNSENAVLEGERPQKKVEHTASNGWGGSWTGITKLRNTFSGSSVNKIAYTSQDDIEIHATKQIDTTNITPVLRTTDQHRQQTPGRANTRGHWTAGHGVKRNGSFDMVTLTGEEAPASPVYEGGLKHKLMDGQPARGLAVVDGTPTSLPAQYIPPPPPPLRLPSVSYKNKLQKYAQFDQEAASSTTLPGGFYTTPFPKNVEFARREMAPLFSSESDELYMTETDQETETKIDSGTGCSFFACVDPSDWLPQCFVLKKQT